MLWQNFLPEPVLPLAASRDLPDGYAGYEPPSGPSPSHRGLLVHLVRLLQDGQRNAHILGERLTTLVLLHHATAR